MKNEKEITQNYARDGVGVLTGLLIGGLAGAGAMLLLAPQSGEKTRAQIQEKTIQLRDETTGVMDEAMAKAWLAKNKIAWTFGGGIMKNPGRYLVLYPTGQASPLPNPNNPTQTEGMYPFSANPGDKFKGWDISTNFDWMPNQSITFRVEFVHRESSVPYFAGKGGVTSPTGYQWTALPEGWRPDLVKSENRIIFCALFRI